MPEATIGLIFTTSFVVALSGAMMPGPLLAIAIREAARGGFWTGPKLILGHGILELSLVTALAVGLSEFMKSALVSAIIGLIGGSILLVMGLVTVKKGKEQVAIPAASSEAKGQGRMVVLSGIIASISNPYWFLWWVTLGTVYLLWSLSLGIIGVASFFTGHILADLGWYALVAFIVATGRKAMNAKIYRVLLVGCGVALVALGGYFIASGIRFLAG